MNTALSSTGPAVIKDTLKSPYQTIPFRDLWRILRLLAMAADAPEAGEALRDMLWGKSSSLQFRRRNNANISMVELSRKIAGLPVIPDSSMDLEDVIRHMQAFGMAISILRIDFDVPEVISGYLSLFYDGLELDLIRLECSMITEWIIEYSQSPQDFRRRRVLEGFLPREISIVEDLIESAILDASARSIDLKRALQEQYCLDVMKRSKELGDLSNEIKALKHLSIITGVSRTVADESDLTQVVIEYEKTKRIRDAEFSITRRDGEIESRTGEELMAGFVPKVPRPALEE